MYSFFFGRNVKLHGHPLDVPLDRVFKVGQPSLKFLAESNHEFIFESCGEQRVTIDVFLKVGKLPVIFTKCDKIKFDCEMVFKGKPVTPKVIVQSLSSWTD